jgi:hypothetical protein
MISEQLLINLINPKNWLKIVAKFDLVITSDIYYHLKFDGFEMAIDTKPKELSYTDKITEIMIKSSDVKIMITIPSKRNYDVLATEPFILSTDCVEFYSIRFLNNKPDLTKIEDALFNAILGT